MSLLSLDLFTGIGGMVRCMEGISTPLAYCECDPTRIRTLRSLMKRGMIPTAPVASDVRTFSYSGNAVPDMVIGSWPCRGFSVAGPRNGFEHPQSALFTEFVRIVNEIKPKFVFQENVPEVAGKALDDVIEAFKEDYDLSWIVLPAYIVGAPHIRKRWFCFGVRKDVTDETLDNLDAYVRADWSVSPPRMTLDRIPNVSSRLSMLGNAVVPDCARLAFLYLFSGMKLPLDRVLETTSVRLSRPDVSQATPLPPPGDSSCRRYCGCVVDGRVCAIQRRPIPKPNLGLVLDPGSYSCSNHNVSEDNLITELHHFALWATPRGGALTPTRAVSKRTTTDLSTQLRFERGTPDALRPGRVNPNFVEWMMAFPVDWTKCVEEEA